MGATHKTPTQHNYIYIYLSIYLYIYLYLYLYLYIYIYIYIYIYNLGAVFDPNMNMSAHVSKVIKSSNYHLRNIGKIRMTIVMDFSVESLMSCYAGSRKSKTMLLEWLVAPKSMITSHQF